MEVNPNLTDFIMLGPYESEEKVALDNNLLACLLLLLSPCRLKGDYKLIADLKSRAGH